MDDATRTSRKLCPSYHNFVDADLTPHIGRDPFAPCLPLPLHLCLPGFQGASDGRESADDDAVRARGRARESEQAEQGQSVQVPLLSRGEPCQGREGDSFVIFKKRIGEG